VNGHHVDLTPPDPILLAEYEAVLPGSAERIFAMTEKKLDAEIYLDAAQLRAESRAFVGATYAAAFFWWVAVAAAVGSLWFYRVSCCFDRGRHGVGA